jgi:hypothetical protein
MHTRELETRSAGTWAWAAAQNARMRNIVNSSHYTAAERIRAERMSMALSLVYNAQNIYINYRKTKIAVKVDGARVRDPVLLRELEADWAVQGVRKTQSPQGVIYSFG